MCEGGLFSLEVESRLRGLQLRVWGGGGVYEKINSEKGRETMCLKGGGGVYEKINSEVEKERLYVSTKRGGGGGKGGGIFWGKYTKVFLLWSRSRK